MEKENTGITLIALVITIIVLLILAGVTVATLTGNSGLLGKTTEAQFKSEVKQYEEELRLSINAEEIEALGNRIDTINVFKKFPSTGEENENFEQEMKENIPSFNNAKYGNKLEIRNDELIYIGEENSQERKWFGEIQLSLAKYFITVNYVDKQGNKLAEPETKSTTTGIYEIEPKVIEGYEAERPLYEGKIKEDTEITIKYYQESGNLAYIGLDESGNETEDESKIVAYTVSGIGDFTGEDLVIPRTYNNKPIKEIREYAFKQNNSIKKVIIQSNVEKVNTFAFYIAKIEEVFLNSENVGNRAFRGCSKLKNVEIGKNFKISNNLLFEDCSSIVQFKVDSESSNLTTWDFLNCNSLKQIQINTDNKAYKEIDGILYSKDGKEIKICPPGKILGEYTVPSGVIKIGNSAFLRNLSITKLTIPETVEEIGQLSFHMDSNLSDVDINAKIIHDRAFRDSGVQNVVIGENVERLEGLIFEGCGKLERLVINTGKANVTGEMFLNCKKLENIVISEDNETYKTINGVVYTKNDMIIKAYPQAKGENFTIVREVSKIGEYAFRGALNISEINYDGTVVEWGNLVKGIGWNQFSNIKKIICTDGEVNL